MIPRRCHNLGGRLTGTNLATDCDTAVHSNPISQQVQVVLCSLANDNGGHVANMFILNVVGDLPLGGDGQPDHAEERQLRPTFSGKIQSELDCAQRRLRVVNGTEDPPCVISHVRRRYAHSHIMHS